MLNRTAKARDFTKEYLRVEWLFDLPENMRLMQPVMTENSTQQCATKGQGRVRLICCVFTRIWQFQEDVAHFGHLLQFSLNRRPASSADCLKAGLVWPRLLLRVIAEDSWGRFFIEGYLQVQMVQNHQSLKAMPRFHCRHHLAKNSIAWNVGASRMEAIQKQTHYEMPTWAKLWIWPTSRLPVLVTVKAIGWDLVHQKILLKVLLFHTARPMQ